jgi:hypothetical protein
MPLPSGDKLRGTARGLIALAASARAPGTDVLVTTVVVPTKGEVVSVVVVVVVVVIVGVTVGPPKGPATDVLLFWRPPPSEPPA